MHSGMVPLKSVFQIARLAAAWKELVPLCEQPQFSLSVPDSLLWVNTIWPMLSDMKQRSALYA